MKFKIMEAMETAEHQAWKALAGYKFWMFGYHAAAWVKYNRLLDKPDRLANPFRSAVKLAMKKLEDE